MTVFPAAGVFLDFCQPTDHQIHDLLPIVSVNGSSLVSDSGLLEPSLILASLDHLLYLSLSLCPQS